jgi:energy-coupling factor transport system substrate-specific component
MAIFILCGLLGVLAFLYPFLLAATETAGGDASAHARDAPLIVLGVVVLALLAVLIEARGGSMGAKTIATLAVLVALTGVVRFLALSIPGLAGFSPIFVPIILAGRVFGARFGFLVGAFGLLASALITGGVGPWLPFQMFTAGWCGMSAGWLGWLLGRPTGHALEVAILALFGLIWGFLFGFILNLYFWPFAIGMPDQTWVRGEAPVDILFRYLGFYLATSIWWDSSRAIGNGLCLIAVGGPLVRALARFQRRFDFQMGA